MFFFMGWLAFYIKKHENMFMNIETFRNLVATRAEREGCSICELAARYRIEQSSLSRFLNGKTGINGGNLLKLLPYVWSDFKKEMRVSRKVYD